MYNSIRITGSHTNAYVMAEKTTDMNVPENIIIEGKLKKPDWSLNTVMLASYPDIENLLSASNFDINSLITGYKVFREENGVLYYISDTSKNIKTLYDFNTKANTKLSFYIYPKITGENDKTILSSPIKSDYITPSWNGWSVIGLKKQSKNEYTVDKNNIWNFQLNIESGTIGDTVNRQLHETYSRFPKVMYGKRRYKEGSLSCLLGNISQSDCEYYDSPALMDKWEEFVNNGELKLLKTTKGMIYPVDIYNSKFNIMDEVLGEVIELSFDYVQLEDANNIRVYLMGEAVV